MGLVFNNGFQRELTKNGRLRFTSFLNIGQYITLFDDDCYECNNYRFGTLGLNCGLAFDLVRIGAFSMFWRNDVRCDYMWIPKNETIWYREKRHDFSESFGAMIGFRVNPKQSRCAVNITPLAMYFCSDEFFAANMKFEIDIKL